MASSPKRDQNFLEEIKVYFARLHYKTITYESDIFSLWALKQRTTMLKLLIRMI